MIFVNLIIAVKTCTHSAPQVCSTEIFRIDLFIVSIVLFFKIKFNLFSVSVMQQAHRGSVKPFVHFNAKSDADILHKAMKGIGTFVWLVIKKLKLPNTLEVKCLFSCVWSHLLLLSMEQVHIQTFESHHSKLANTFCNHPFFKLSWTNRSSVRTD